MDLRRLEIIPKEDCMKRTFPLAASESGRITCLGYIFEGEAVKVTNLSIVSVFASIYRPWLSHSRI
jgi:hypothetical protein